MLTAVSRDNDSRVTIHRQVRPELKQSGDTAGVIIMTVRKQKRIDIRRIDFRQCGIMEHEVTLTGIEEQCVPVGFDPERQAVFGPETVARCTVIDQNGHRPLFDHISLSLP